MMSLLLNLNHNFFPLPEMEHAMNVIMEQPMIDNTTRLVTEPTIVQKIGPI